MRGLLRRSRGAASASLLLPLILTLLSVAAAPLAHAQAIRGAVFEDLNYGGGAGRDSAAASGVGQATARAELYGAGGAFVTSTTTDAQGAYAFTGLAPGTYFVRVVNGSVSSSRAGFVLGTHLPVQTFRTDAPAGTAVPVTDYVGGTNPTTADPGNGGAGSTFNTTTYVFTAGPSGTAQSVARVVLGATDVIDVDFGFNFNTIVNTNNAGQGSLRQFLTNANGLSNAGLAIVGQTAGTDVSIFMISDGQVHPGQRAGLPNQLDGSGTAVITPSSALPVIVGAQTVVDGRTQTSNIGNTNPVNLGTGGTVGVDGLPIGQVPGPEVSIRDTGALANGIEINANGVTVRGLAIYGFGNAAPDAAVLVHNAVTGALIEDNTLGTTSSSFTDPGAGLRNRAGIYSDGGDNGTFRNNLASFNGLAGIILANASSGWVVSGNEFRDNGTESTDGDGVTVNASPSNAFTGNRVTGTSSQGLVVTGAGATGNTFTNNTVTGNGVGLPAGFIQSPGFAMRGGAATTTLDRNVISANYGAGIQVNNGSTGTILTRNSFVGNGTITARNGAGATGQIGIDLNSAGDNINLGTAPFFTVNDAGDADAGGNALLNFPVLTAASIVGGNLVMSGFARPGSAVEFFVGDGDASGFGEGQTYLFTASEGSGADSDAGTGTYGPGPVNGLAQGTDTTNRFAFAVPLPGGVVAGTLITAAATVAGETSEFSGVVQAVNVTPVTVTPTSGLITTEAGGPDTFTVVLNVQPTANVTIGLTSGDLTEGTVAPASLTFTNGNWNVAQNVIVTGVDDLVDDGDIAYTVVTAAATSTDPIHNGFNAPDVSVTNIDDDAAGIVVNPTAGLVTTEAGGPAGFTVVLATQPTADVTIGLTSNDLTEGTVAPASVTFNTGNWNVPVNVTVTGVDDLIDDGDILYTVVTAAATSTDPVYSGVNASDVSVTNADDDSAGIIGNPTSGLVTTEAGGPAGFTVVLATQPTADVTVGLTSSDLTEGTVAPPSVTFNTGNWNVPVNVTVTGVDDPIDDGDILYTIVTAAATSTDPIYSGVNPSDVSVTNTDDDSAGIVVNPTSGLVTTEAGGPAGFTVVLATQPTADVTIGLTSGDLTEGTVAPASITFNTGNWNVPVNVTVTGVDDLIDDGDILYTIVTAAATSADPVYNGTNASDVSVTNTDDDAAGVTVNPTSGLITTEAGGPAGFTLVLNTQPTADVTIGLTSSDLTEGTVAPPSITFNNGNWNVPVNVTVTGVDDLIDDGDILYTIVTAAATSADPVYNGTNASDVSVTNTDDDAAGIVVNPTSGLITTEAGGPAGFTVVLATQPTADVTIGLTSSDLTEGTVAPPSITFNTGNWNVPMNVAVTGVDDLIDDGDILYTIVTAAATSADPVYNGTNASDVSVTNTDDDSGGIVVNPTSGLVTTEAGGPAGFTVVLATQPTADVTIGLTSSDLTEGTVAPPSITFNTGNWNVPVNVTVTGVDDPIDDGDIAYTIVTAAATSADPVYNGTNASDVSVTNTDDDSGGILVNPTSGLVTTEAGGPAGFTIVLSTQPTADVTIGLTSSDLTEGTVAPPSITFNTGNWNVPVNVTVTGVDDIVVDGNIVYSIVTAAASSVDPVYNGVNPSDVSVTNTDDDAAGVTVNPTSGLVTTEAGGPAGFTIVLDSQPTADVTIGLTSSDLTEGTVAPPSITFNTGNWNVPVNVTVTGVDDIVVDGNIVYSIVTAAASSVDPVYNGVNPSDVSVTNTDDDAAGVTVNPTSGLVTTEAGGPAGFTIVLDTQPTADVTIGLTSSDLTEGTVAPPSITFNTGNWNVPVNVTVTGVDDIVVDGNIVYSIVTAAASSVDPVYNGVNPSDVSVTNTDDDAAGVTVNPTSGLVTTEAGGPAGFTIVLDTQPAADVTIGLTSSDLTEGTVAPASVTFTTVNWNAVRTITVTGVDDAILDGTIGYTIVTGAASSADPAYSGFAVADVSVANLDDDGAQVVQLELVADEDRVEVGETVGLTLHVRNLGVSGIAALDIIRELPDGLALLPGTATRDGNPIVDAGGAIVSIGPLAALVDSNGNGRADPGEPGYALVRWRAVVGAGAYPGSKTVAATAASGCSTCVVSNRAETQVTVEESALLARGTILGRVFEDRDRDGYQDRDEPGLFGAAVALDDGTTVMTDAEGLFHVPEADAGQRLLKLDVARLPYPATPTTDVATVTQVTGGLFTSVRFGVAFDRDTLQIGSPPVRGLALIPEQLELGIDVAGNAVRSAVVVNGAKVPIRTVDALLSPDGAGDVLRLAGARLDPSASFELQVAESGRVRSWTLEILSPADSVIRAFEGTGSPPARVEWDGQLSSGAVLRSEDAYAHRLRVHYEDGVQVEGPRRAFGVDQHLSFGLTLTEEAFAPATASLAPEAKVALSRVAEDIRRAAGDSIFVEGHFDSTGSASESAMRSQERAEMVAEYLVDQEDIPRRRITVRALGASRPIASNGTLEGRELNRRVEIFGSKVDVQRSALRDVFRGKPSARINGQAVAVDSMGRFAIRLPATTDSLDVAMTDRSGRTANTKVRLPRLEILEPKGEIRLPFGGETQDAQVDPRDPRPPEKTEVASLGSLERGRRAARLKLRARTEPGVRAIVDGRRVPVAEDGSFEADLPLHLGRNAVGVVLQDSTGMTTVANVVVRALDRTEEGGEVIAVEETPDLTVYMPPGGTVLTTQSLAVTGKTKAGNLVFANGDPLLVGPDGSFAGYVRLPEGHSRITFDVVDSEGRRGTLERPVEVRSKRMFLVALADGVVGGGGTGPRGETGTWTQGRIAYQLRGWIAGRVLVTSAFDSQRRSWGSLFSDLDDAGRDRLLTNLDPDRLYPVFGDASVASYGAPGGGRFFVALEADAVKASVGDFPIAFDEVELAAFHRTLYGAQVQVQPVRLALGGGSKPGGTGTELKLFGAQAGHVHVRDVLEATGGTLYYLSHRDVIMGSVQVAISVHDRNTGLPLVRQPQIPGQDFIVKEAEGRILFQRPVSSVASDGSLLDAGALGGNPVFIEVDYEAEGTVGEKSALGGRLSQKVGPIQLGGTMIQDETGTSPYTLRGGDARLRIGTRSWVGTEFATSDGRAGRVFGSGDGGLSFTAFDTTSASSGDAWKVATEVDAGEWFGAPGRVTVGGFLKRVGEGFVSDSEAGAVGSRRVGARAQVDAGRWGIWSGRFDRQERFASASMPTPYQEDLIGAQWRRDMRRLGIAAEFQDQRTDSAASERRGGVKLSYLLTDSLRASVEHQRSLGGPDVDQSAIGAEWRLPMGLALEGRASDGTEGRGFRGGASLALGGRRFYVREELLRSASGPQGMTVVGVQTPLGRMSRAYSEYQWLRRGGEDHTASVVGVEQGWRFASGFNGSAFGEYGGRGGGGTSLPHTTLALQLGYSGKFPLGVTTRGEFRKMDAGNLDKQFLVATHMDLRLVGGLSLLGDHRLSEALPRGPGESTRYEERSVGMSYRHARSDRVEALARLTDLQDRRAAGPSDSLRSTRGLTVGAVEVRMRLWPDLEWAAKGATRVMREGAGDIAPSDAHSTLWTSRVDYAFARPFRVGVQYQQLAQKEAGDQRGGWLQELTWDPDKHLRFGVGYNFTRISGNEFDTTGDDAGGWFVRAQSRY